MGLPLQSQTGNGRTNAPKIKSPLLIVGEIERRTSDGRTLGKVVAHTGPAETGSRNHGPEFDTYHEQNGKSLQHHQAGLGRRVLRSIQEKLTHDLRTSAS